MSRLERLKSLDFPKGETLSTWLLARPLSALLIVAGLQTAALVWMVQERASLLRSGQEIVLPVVPVDPRSLFRGDYVILSYDISRLDTSLLEGEAPGEAATIWVEIVRTEDRGWRAVKITAKPPADLEPRPDRVVLRARTPRYMRLDSWKRATQLQVRYGLEAYFVPEGKGRELEKLVGKRQVAAIVAVGADGSAQIKGIAIDGKKVHDEPLW